MADAGFIFALVVGGTILVGMLVVAHVSAAWLAAYKQEKVTRDAIRAADQEPFLPMADIAQATIRATILPHTNLGRMTTMWAHRKKSEKAS